MSQAEWQGPCRELAEELRATCAAEIAPADVRVEDRTASMLAEEEDPQVVPHHPIGLIYRFQLQEVQVRHLFGWNRLPIRRRKHLVAFGLEEMFASTIWTRTHGLWCAVSDGRLVETAYRVIKKFGQTHKIEIDFAPRFF